MISGFDITRHLPDDTRYLQLMLEPITVELMAKDMYGYIDYNPVKLSHLLITFSFKTYRRFYFGPQVCIPDYKISVIYSMPSMASGMDLDKFIKSLKEKESFDEVLKEAFAKEKQVPVL